MLKLTHIANAGILIQTPDTRLLIDGIQQEGDFPFSKTPPEVLAQMFQKNGHTQFHDLDYLLFSHAHPDHFSPSLTARYLYQNDVSRILFPKDDSSGTKDLIDAIEKTRTPYWNFTMERGKIRQYRLSKSITATSLCTKHMPQIFAKALCNTLLITIADKNLLFLSDCSYMEKELFRIFSETKIDIVFINPYFYHDEAGRSILWELLCPNKIVIYHIPFAEDDSIRIRTLVKQDTKKYPAPELVIFCEPMQTITI